MVLLELTIASQDKLDGEKILVHKDDIRRAVTVDMFKEKIPDVVTGEKPRRVSLVFFGPGSSQTVVESLEEIKDMVNYPEADEEFLQRYGGG